MRRFDPGLRLQILLINTVFAEHLAFWVSVSFPPSIVVNRRKGGIPTVASGSFTGNQYRPIEPDEDLRRAHTSFRGPHRDVIFQKSHIDGGGVRRPHSEGRLPIFS